MTDQSGTAAAPSSHLARDSLVVGLATVLARLLGFARDMLIARALGAGPIADAFLVAFRLPNMFRRVLSEGGLNAPFVPVYLKAKAEGGNEAASRFAGEALANFAVALMILVALTEMIAPWLVLGLAGGFRDAPLTYQLAQSYTRLALPFVAFTVLASLVAAILNAEKRFVVAAFAQVALSVVLIGALLLTEWQGQAPYRTAKTLAWSVSLAGFCHLVIVLWALGWRAPGWPRLRFGFSPSMRRMLILGGPALLASATSQFVLLVATQIASAQPGAVSWLYYADRIFQLPLGFVAVAMGVVLLPEIAARENEGDRDGARRTVDGALAFGLLLAIPAAGALVLLAEPIVSVLFERGRFHALDRARTAEALQAFAAGLPPAVMAKVMAQVYFARETPSKPLLAGMVSVAVAAGSGLLLTDASPALGAATAASLAFWTQASLLALMLARDGLWAPRWPLLRHVALAAGAASAMAMALTTIIPLTGGRMVQGSAGLREFALLVGLCAFGAAIYGALAWGLRLFRFGKGARPV